MKSWIRDFFIKKKISRSVSTFDQSNFKGDFDRVAVLVDENQFKNVHLIEDHLKTNKIGSKEIVFKVFRDAKKIEIEKSMFFCPNDLGWTANIIESGLKSFVEKEFDMLICYFDQKNIFLEYINHLSKAKFKVGFSRLENPLTQIDIDVKLSECKTFFIELKKYISLIKK